MRYLTILGAGLLIGTALAVIIPEGIHTLYSNQKCVEETHNQHKRFIDQDLTTLRSQLSYNTELNKPIRFIRDAEKIEAKDHQELANDQLKIKESSKHTDEKPEHEDNHSHSSSSHSAIGITLVLGFVFMLIVDQIGGKISHKPHQVLDTQAIRNKITFTTTLGLVVHSAADGIALGAAAATSKTDVEMIVFIAIMLHKVNY